MQVAGGHNVLGLVAEESAQEEAEGGSKCVWHTMEEILWRKGRVTPEKVRVPAGTGLDSRKIKIQDDNTKLLSSLNPFRGYYCYVSNSSQKANRQQSRGQQWRQEQTDVTPKPDGHRRTVVKFKSRSEKSESKTGCVHPGSAATVRTTRLWPRLKQPTSQVAWDGVVLAT